jgi:hypothetical protein
MQTVALQQRTGGEPPKVRCPECRKMLALPPGGVGALPCNYSLIQVLGAGAAVRAEKEKAAAAEKEKDALEKEMATLLAAAEQQQQMHEERRVEAAREHQRVVDEQAKEVVVREKQEAVVAAVVAQARQEAAEKVAAAMAATANAEEENNRLATEMAGLLATQQVQQVQQKASQRQAVPVQWQVPAADITDVKFLGEGTFSAVWEVEYQGARVAFKRIRGNGADARAKVAELGHEARGLMKAQHPNVVTLLGVSMDDPSRSGLLMELAEHGTLRDVLDAAAQSAVATGGIRAGSGLSATKQLEFASNIAAGIAWLHANKPTPIVHRCVTSNPTIWSCLHLLTFHLYVLVSSLSQRPEDKQRARDGRRNLQDLGFRHGGRLGHDDRCLHWRARGRHSRVCRTRDAAALVCRQRQQQ